MAVDVDVMNGVAQMAGAALVWWWFYRIANPKQPKHNKKEVLHDRED